VSDAQQRLIRCFQAVFPELSQGAVAHANVSSVAAWDSVATVTLAAAVEEEFDIQFEVEEIETMNSFQSCLNLLTERRRAQ
jgi:acyl carrier protein